ncbi:MAG: hypothetical protein IT437_01845 [Phycisphaerales bacterium]|nr:hypothetical protein [Phycisphaerales bacterium]
MKPQPHHTPEVHEEPDAWHRHTPDEGPSQPEHAGKINVPILMGVFVSTVVFVSAAIAFTIVYFTRHLTDLRQERIETTVLGGPARDYRDAAFSHLNQYEWADAKEGRVSLPIEEAKKRVIRGYSTK